MLLKNSIELALKEIEKAMQTSTASKTETFIYDGDSYPCHVGTQTVSSVLDTGGFSDTQQTVLVVRKSVFTDNVYPEDNEKITFRSVVYYVDTVNTDPTDTFLNITLKKNK